MIKLLYYNNFQKFIIYLVLAQVVHYSCSIKPSVERDIHKNLDKVVHLDMLDSIQKGDSIIPFKELRQRYKYISLVYLEEGCHPCYLKFIDWHHKLDSIVTKENHTVLFILKGTSYKRFIDNVLEAGFIEVNYFAAIDRKYSFLDGNLTIPKWIIDSSILIDSDNKIKMIGEPWKTKEMTELYRKICQ